ncbi:hypothetical protein F5Y19DRAFT_438299, partial [Xylariaceae sp. FL1651]
MPLRQSPFLVPYKALLQVLLRLCFDLAVLWHPSFSGVNYTWQYDLRQYFFINSCGLFCLGCANYSICTNMWLSDVLHYSYMIVSYVLAKGRWQKLIEYVRNEVVWTRICGSEKV